MNYVYNYRKYREIIMLFLMKRSDLTRRQIDAIVFPYGVNLTSVGRVPLTGHFPPPFGYVVPLWQAGPMARFVEDLILTLPVIAGVDWRDPAIIPMPLGDPDAVELNGLRAAFYTDNGIIPPTPETVDVVRKTAQVLSDAGMVVIEDMPAGIEHSFELMNDFIEADGGEDLEKLLESAGTTEMHPWTIAIMEMSRAKTRSSAEFQIASKRHARENHHEQNGIKSRFQTDGSHF